MQRFPSFHRNSSSTGIQTAREHLSDILNRHYSATAVVAQREKSEKRSEGDFDEVRGGNPSLGTSTKRDDGKTTSKMPSSKGEPTDPELREEVKEEVKSEEKGEFHYPCT